MLVVECLETDMEFQVRNRRSSEWTNKFARQPHHCRTLKYQFIKHYSSKDILGPCVWHFPSELQLLKRNRTSGSGYFASDAMEGEADSGTSGLNVEQDIGATLDHRVFSWVSHNGCP